MGTLLEGNANDDNKINIQDLGILTTTFEKSSGQAGYNPQADFDRNARSTSLISVYWQLTLAKTHR